MAEDAHGLNLLVKAGVLDESGAGHPLARHLLGLSPPSPHAEGEGHEQEVDVSVFDLATRMHKLDTCYEWAAESKAHAEDLLFGARPRVIWWWQRSPRAQHSYPLEHAFLSADTCVHAFHIERAVCEKLCLILDDPKNYNSEKALVLAGKEFPGYAGYPYVHADGGVSPFVQQRRTVRFQGATEINFLLREVQEIWDLVQAVRHALGLPLPNRGVLQPGGKKIKAMHLLLQDETQQASFSWHNDAEDILVKGETSRSAAEEMTTVVVSLSEVRSAMRIWGCTPVVYEGRGSAVAFPGAALHETVPRLEGNPAQVPCRKVALFFN